jgi:hypothetical protein
VTLVVTGLGVRMAVYGLEVPFGLLEPRSILLRVFLLFALLLAGRRAIVALLLQLLTVLFSDFLDFPALLNVVTRRVVHWAMHTSIIIAGHLMGHLSPRGPQPPPTTVVAAAVVGAPASGWLLPLTFFFSCSCSCSCCYLPRQQHLLWA